MTIIVTSGADFICSNFDFRMLKKYPNYLIICLDKLSTNLRTDLCKFVQRYVKFYK